MSGINGRGAKKITVRMLEAYYNAIPELIRLAEDRAKEGDIGAKMALSNFYAFAQQERDSLDQCEAVFGFAALLHNADVFEGKSLEQISMYAAKFCEANGLGMPEGVFAHRLKMPNLKYDEAELGKCESCEFRGIDGGPGPAMVCNHPEAKEAYIISWLGDDGDKRRTPKLGMCPKK